MRALVALLVLALLLPLPARAGSADAPPGWTPGDFVVLHGTTTLSNGATTDIVTNTTVVGADAIEVGGVVYDAVKSVQRAQVWTNSSTGTSSKHSWTNTTTWVRASDRALIRTASLSGTGSTTTITYDPPCLSLRYPLAVGDQWAVDCAKTTVGPTGQSTSGTDHSNATVLREEQVTVAAGTFDAFVVESVTPQGSKLDTWFAPSTCAAVKIVSTSGATVFTYEMTAYACADPTPPATGGTSAPPVNATTNATNATAPTPPANVTENATAEPNATTPAPDVNATTNGTTEPPADTTPEATPTPTEPTPAETTPTPEVTPVASPTPVSSSPLPSTETSSTSASPPPASTTPGAVQAAAVSPSPAPSSSGGDQIPAPGAALALAAVGLLALALRRR